MRSASCSGGGRADEGAPSRCRVAFELLDVMDVDEPGCGGPAAGSARSTPRSSPGTDRRRSGRARCARRRGGRPTRRPTRPPAAGRRARACGARRVVTACPAPVDDRLPPHAHETSLDALLREGLEKVVDHVEVERLYRMIAESRRNDERGRIRTLRVRAHQLEALFVPCASHELHVDECQVDRSVAEPPIESLAGAFRGRDRAHDIDRSRRLQTFLTR